MSPTSIVLMSLNLNHMAITWATHALIAITYGTKTATGATTASEKSNQISVALT